MGHIISEKYIAVDPAKIKDIIEWPVPKDVHDIRSFMGIMRYYRIFIEKKSRIDNPIITSQKKGVKFMWIQQCKNSFDKLKNLLPTMHILKIANPYKYFVVCTNASKDGLGGILTQDGHVFSMDI